jgi:hypothetical protein
MSNRRHKLLNVKNAIPTHSESLNVNLRVHSTATRNVAVYLTPISLRLSSLQSVSYYELLNDAVPDTEVVENPGNEYILERMTKLTL